MAKRKKKKEGTCACNTPMETKEECCCGEKTTEPQGECCCGEKTSDTIESIKVLGAGCKSCHVQYENVKEAAKNLGILTEVEYITDMEKVMAYGVMSMPAIVINEKVVSMGKVLKSKDVEKLLQK